MTSGPVAVQGRWSVAAPPGRLPLTWLALVLTVLSAWSTVVAAEKQGFVVLPNSAPRFLVLGPVVIQPDCSVSTTSAISSLPKLGAPKGSISSRTGLPPSIASRSVIPSPNQSPFARKSFFSGIEKLFSTKWVETYQYGEAAGRGTC